MLNFRSAPTKQMYKLSKYLVQVFSFVGVLILIPAVVAGILLGLSLVKEPIVRASESFGLLKTQVETGQGDVVLQFSSPVNNQVLTGSTVSVQVYALQRTANSVAFDRVSLKLDSNSEVMLPKGTNSYIFQNVSSGQHTITGHLLRVDNTKITGSESSVSFTTQVSSPSAVTLKPPVNVPDRMPYGYLDGVNNQGLAFGWAVDGNDSDAPVDVHFYVDRPAGGGRSVAFTARADKQRSDVGPHGFEGSIPAQFKDGRTHRLFAYAVNLQDGSRWRQLLGGPIYFRIQPSGGASFLPGIDIPDRLPYGYLDKVTGEGVASGWVVDGNDISSFVDVHFYVDRPAGDGRSVAFTARADKQRSDVGPHGFEVNIPIQFRDGKTHKLYAYGVNISDSSKWRLLLGSPIIFTASGVAPTPTPTVTPTPSVTPTSAGLPINFWKTGTTLPVSRSIQLNIAEIPSTAQTAVLTLNTFDPDFADEGYLCLNLGDKCISLFGSQGTSARQEVNANIQFEVPANWLKVGNNTLTFTHTQTDGYKILGVDVKFTNVAVPTPTPITTPTPTASPTPTPPPNTAIRDGFIDSASSTKVEGWFFDSLRSETNVIITYVNTSTNQTYLQTGTRTISRTDATTYLKNLYGQGLVVEQPLGFTVNPSSVLGSGTYKIQSVKFAVVGTPIAISTPATNSFTIGVGPTPTPTPTQTPTPTLTPTPTPPPVISGNYSCVKTPDGIRPECPRVSVATALSATPSNGSVITVNSGGNLQTALNNAKLGDTIVLQAGATFVGEFVLPKKTGSGWITIRSSNMAGLPPEGTRVGPQHASAMPKIVTPNVESAIRTEPGAFNYRLMGLEISQQTNYVYSILKLGDSPMRSMSEMPYNIIVDRSYIHGTANDTSRRCIQLNSGSSAIVDSYLSDCHEKGADSQAIGGWTGSGPYKISNNYLEGAGENIIFGGSDPQIANLVPSDIEITRNHIKKPIEWKSSGKWSVKNLFELKNSRRVLIDSNLLENNWTDAQAGFGILFTVRNQEGIAPWSVVEDVTFTNNIIRNSQSGINILGADYNNPSQQTKRILIKNNLMEGVTDKHMQVITDTQPTLNLIVDHNTFLHSGTGTSALAVGDTVPVAENFIFTNNLISRGEYGIYGSGVGEGDKALARFTINPVFRKNVFFGAGNGSGYPQDNSFVPLSSVGFSNYSSGNYQLNSSSAYRNAGLDGKDLGVEWSELQGRTSGVGSGSSTQPNPPPPPSNIVDGFVDSFSASKLDGWFFTQRGDTSATVTYVNTVTNATYIQTATRSITRTDAASYVTSNYGLTSIAQPLGFSIVPSNVLTAAGTYRIQSVKLNVSNISISLSSSAGGVITITSTTPPPPGPTGQAATWSNLKNMSLTGGVLSKTGGSADSNDASAITTQVCSSGNCYLEFTANELSDSIWVGFAQDVNNTASSPTNSMSHALNYWFYTVPGFFEVYALENGAYKGEKYPTPVPAKLKLAVENGTVRYYHNDAVFYTSTQPITYPFAVKVSARKIGTAISNLMLYGFGSGTTTPPPPAANTAPIASINLPTSGTTFAAGDVINFSGSATDAQDGNLAANKFSWSVVFHHDTHTHPFEGPINGVTSGSFTIPRTGEPSDNIWYRISLTVTDSAGLTNTVTRDVIPRKVQLSLASSPSGLQITLNGQPQTTPYTFTSVVGYNHVIGATSPQTLSGNTYAFTSWSNGGTASKTITAPASATTYTASFTQTGTTNTVRDGYVDSFNASKVAGWGFDNNQSTQVRIVYENVSNTSLNYTQTVGQTISRTDAANWLRTQYGSQLAVTQPLGFEADPKAVITQSGTYRIRSVTMLSSNTIIQISPAATAQVSITIGTTPPPPPPSSGGTFTASVVASGFDTATAMEFAPDGRLFVAEKSGRLRVIKNGQLLSTPFVTLSVRDNGEAGLLGIAFDPNFASNNYVYVYYTTSANSHNRVSRFTASGDTAVGGSELALLDLPGMGNAFHHGGAIHFGTDGKLYVAVGDHQDSALAQSLSSPFGKMLRINSDGSIPTDNPFYNSATGVNRAIWAFGFRNPYTFAVDKVSGKIYVNDVGQNTYEEVNELVRGGNYGWPTCEGAQGSGVGNCNSTSFTYPVFVYNHSIGSAITGGVFYRGSAYPSEYTGNYFFGDYTGGWIRRMTQGGQVSVWRSAAGPIDLKVGNDGNLYMLSIYDGNVTKYTYAQ